VTGGAYNAADESFSMDLVMSGGTLGGTMQMTEVARGTDFYVSSPMFASMLPGGKSWVKIDLEDVIGEGINADPREQLAQLESVSEITVVGREEIRGAQTTHYRALIDAGAVGITGHAAGTQIPMDIWVDSNGYVRRETVQTPYDVLEGGGSMEIRMELFGFGSAPQVAVPPDSMVFDGSQLIEDLGGLDQLSQ
jgi:hypothetical protein